MDMIIRCMLHNKKFSNLFFPDVISCAIYVEQVHH